MMERESWWCVAEGDDSLPGNSASGFGIHGGGWRRTISLLIAPALLDLTFPLPSSLSLLSSLSATLSIHDPH